ncbi:CvpA family protein [Kordiimonas pumila]|uniref:CvpA family protein n=1 Tax=Kordiimonas pumila TaxID=2161677 RepID=A0ABV7D1W9_9PROT|nr:CvpA family protein [Kordiimonas pumila]
MDAGSLTAFDIGVLIIVALSTLLAFGKGFATVALSLAAWVGAILAVVFGFTAVQPYGRDLISPNELADIITLLVVFFVSLFILKQLAGFIGGMIKNGPAGFLDRSLGALFGLLRGMVIVSLLYFGFVKLFPGKEQPDWMQEARLKPLVAWGAEMLEGYASEALGRDPKDVGSEYLQKAADAVPSQFIEEELEKQAAKYIEQNQEKLDDLINQVTDDVKKSKSGS